MARPPKKTSLVVLTVGHSTRDLETFLHLLQVHGITRLVDVRTIPKSRHNPQFNKEALPAALKAVEIAYQHMPELGGLRHPLPNSPNQAWRNASFRGFADYMQTPEFAKGLRKLMEMAQKDRVAVMCAEAVPWRCHRSLIADALLARHARVEHIMSETALQMHVLTPWACIQGNRVTYPNPQTTIARDSG